MPCRLSWNRIALGGRLRFEQRSSGAQMAAALSRPAAPVFVAITLLTCSTVSSRPSRAEWGWDFRFVAPLSRRMVGTYERKILLCREGLAYPLSCPLQMGNLRFAVEELDSYRLIFDS